ncbi:Hsp18_2 [Mycobacteroides abscessus subsp. abscessus]|nr:Hsp18_2 [Mycobacteroides abscessus subsp. abscessus]
MGRGLALDKVSGEYVDGVLQLTIPVAEEAKPRKIQVQRRTEHHQVGDTIHGEVSAEQDQQA